MSDKMTRKELKAPDQFQKLGAEAVPFLVQHQKSIVIGVIAVVVVGLGVSLVHYLGERSEGQASQGLGQALEVVSREVSVSGTALGEPGGQTPFKSESEKTEATVTSLTAFRAKEPGSRAAATAALPLGDALLRQGKGAEALAAFDEYLKASSQTDPLRPLALEGRGYALESKKDYDAALAAFDQLSRENQNEFMKGMGLYHRGRVLLLQNKTDEAAKQFQELQSSAPGTAAARLAAERMSLLVAQGVKLPEVAAAAPAGTGDAGL